MNRKYAWVLAHYAYFSTHDERSTKTKAFPIAWKRLFDYNKLIHRMHHVCSQAGEAFYERSKQT